MTAFTRQRIGIFTCVAILLWMVLGIFVYKSWLVFPDDGKLMKLLSPEKQLEQCKEFGRKLGYGFWKKVNLRRGQVPLLVKESASLVEVQSNHITVQGISVHYLDAKPKEQNTIPVLLLHGMSYTSETWKELGTIQFLSASGFYPVAIDLPGYGQTPAVSDLNKAYFIDQLISALNLQKPVIVSPSMSGSYSLEYLVQFPDKFGGFVPVAPVRTNTILKKVVCRDQDEESNEVLLSVDCQRIIYLLKSDQPNLGCLKVPTLAIWGEKDQGDNSAKLCLLPESQGVEIPEGMHAAYNSNPDFWHKLLYNFLNTLNATKACR